MTGKKKVFVALSGGVDSSTTAALLLDAGFDCTAVFMITNDTFERTRAEAQQVADKLGIRLHVVDVRKEFEQILEYFCSEYARGRTPNPCILCNRHIKFGRLWDFARSYGADFLATGHYARIISKDGQAALYEAVDSGKDQSYALSMVNRDILGHIILPMGGQCKQHTRKLAARLGLGSEHRAESQEICFIPDNNYIAVLERRCPRLVRPGKIVDSEGRALGEHSGIHRFTIGQRRGLRIAMGEPYYVVKIDAETNTVTLGPKEQVMRPRLFAGGVNWLFDKPDAPFRAKVKIRYNDRGSAATVITRDEQVEVEFDESQSAITPGQLAVFYVQEPAGYRVAGGGWIEKAAD